MFRSKKKVDFVSNIDKFLEQFDKTHPPSPSQVAEIRKYKKIYDLRDHVQPSENALEIWEEF